jgi:polyisoprenoid-binding protein YceI
MLKKTLVALALGSALIGGQALAADYAIDKKGQHAFVNFKISHLGYSWLYGTFKDFDGKFSFDAANPEASKVSVTLNTASVDTNHAERDKHIRSDDFLSVGKHPTATFESTSVKSTGEGTADISGNLTLNGVTKPVVIAAEFVGAGDNPFSRKKTVGFEGRTSIKRSEFGVAYGIPMVSDEVQLDISVAFEK